MTRIAAGLPWPSLTLAVTPGTRSDLQRRQVNLRRAGPRRTLNLSLTRLARAACSLASSRSVWERLTADSVRSFTIAAASSAAALRGFTRTVRRGKHLTVRAEVKSRLLSFVLAESGLELVPKEIRRSPAVANDSRRRGVDAAGILLDRSVHHSAMARLKDSEKRGRPDLIHAALLSVTSTPFYLEGNVRILVHTYQDLVLDVAERTRLPKNYLGFRGLMEKTLSQKPAEGLVKVIPAGLAEVVKRVLAPDVVFGLSIQGRPRTLSDLAARVASAKNPCVLVGGFPHGHFSQKTLGLVDELVRIDPRPLEAHVVAARLVYELEKEAEGTND